MNSLLDMRLVIGLFFLLTGLLLLGYYLFNAPAQDSSNTNLWCSILFMLFGSIMILLYAKMRRKER